MHRDLGIRANVASPRGCVDSHVARGAMQVALAVVASVFACPAALHCAAPPILVPNLAVEAPSWPEAIEVTDVNVDGIPDILILNGMDTSPYVGLIPTIQVRMGHGDGSFSALSSYALDAYPQRFAVGRINSDFHPDIAVAISGGVQIMLGSEFGQYGSAGTYAAYGTADIAIGDVLGDGRREVVALRPALNDILLWTADTGTGALGPPVAAGTRPGPSTLVLSRLNGDSKRDLLVANPEDSTVSVYLGSSTAFGARTDIGVGGAPQGIDSIDLDEDGIEDLVVFLAAPNRMRVFPGCGDGSFAAPLETSAPYVPSGFAFGDFDGDGHVDVAITHPASTVSALFGDGNGAFTSAVFAVDVKSGVQVRAADFNLDGRDDLLVSRGISHGWLTVALGKTDRTFGFDRRVPVAQGASDIATGDLDGNGDADIAVACVASVSCLFGVGQGDFLRQDFDVGGTPNSIAAADFNHDGLVDLAVSLRDADRIAVFLGQMGQTLLRVPDLITGRRPAEVDVADFDADANMDVVCANELDSSVFVYLGHGDGTFQPPIVTSRPHPLNAVSVGDLDLDGRTDVVIAENGLFSYATVLTGAGDGTFNAEHSAVGAGDSPISWVAIAPFGDGLPDVVFTIPIGCVSGHCDDYRGFFLVAGTGSGLAGKSLLRSGFRPTAGAAGDLNQDGHSDLAIVNWLTNSITLCLGGEGVFPAEVFDIGTGIAPLAAAIADVNGDGWEDLLVVNGLSPNSVSLMWGVGGLTGVTGVAPPRSLSLGPVRPNPFDTEVTLTIDVAIEAVARVSVLDCAGRVVNTLYDGELGAGTHVIRWDGRTSSGGLAPAGVYYIAASAGDARATRHVVRIR